MMVIFGDKMISGKRNFDQRSSTCIRGNSLANSMTFKEKAMSGMSKPDESLAKSSGQNGIKNTPLREILQVQAGLGIHVIFSSTCIHI